VSLPSSTTPDISVVVPTYQRRASILRLVNAFAGQTLACERFEVVVAIDGSTDGTLEAIRALSSPFRLRAHWQSNRGRAAACNAGVLASAGALIVILDDDMVPVPEFLVAHLASHAPGRVTGVVGAVPIAFDENSPPLVRHIGENFNAHLDRLKAKGKPTKVRDFYSGNFSIERHALLDVGGFDESFNEYGNEDVELAIRLRKAGVELRYSAEAMAWQRYEKSFAQLATAWPKAARRCCVRRSIPSSPIRCVLARIVTYRGNGSSFAPCYSPLLG
jgi:GT2 family glycosyltransferase